MRATMELYGDAMEYPPVHVKIVLGDEDLTVKVHTYMSVLLSLWGPSIDIINNAAN